MSSEQNLNPSDAAVQEAIKSDPWGYHKAVLERSNLGLDKIIPAAKNQTDAFINNYIGGLIKAIKLHSEELSIFRTIESMIASSAANKEQIDAMFAELHKFREKSRKEAIALAAASKS